MEPSTILLADLWPCLQGMIPAALSTSSRDGVPNITFVSQIYYVDADHVAISHQFFNKTHRNVREHPLACAMVLDPRTLQGYRLYLRYDHSESSGPLFDSMSLQLQAIASYAGMTDVFRLQAVDVYQVLRIERMDGFTRTPTPPAGEQPSRLLVDQDLEGLRLLSERMGRCELLGDLLESTLRLLDERLGFRHSMILLADEANAKLITIASHGYSDNGVGSEVGIGEGLIGMVARARCPLRLSAIDHSLRYARAVRGRVEAVDGAEAVCREIPLPGLPGASGQLAVPLVSHKCLIGVLAVECTEPLAFMAREDTLLMIVAGQLAAGIEQLSREVEEPTPGPAVRSATKPRATAPRTRQFSFFRADDCIFVDGDYLIRNTPARILWRILTQHREAGRCDFTNRELRMDAWLGLPEFKDNLESRLILLRKRLEQKCPDIRLVPRGRGRFALETEVAIELAERGS
ncbi:MAG: GAF domain-containing protein [Nitrospira sp.]|nr:GAF domain-containing protein [Nitrospira sp.]MEB2339412.1 GAF domain-containing protein [Nitrospirales bacterium]QOJ36051.1 MAG: GAF domain-containing protein [Nitrospira sp.]RIK60976.1 MAG: GAF sensor protein [Nitrospira sp.]